MLEALWRTLFINTLLNDRNLQNAGFAYCMEPALRRIHRDRESYLARMRSSFEYFSSNPFFFPLILGLCIHLERKGKTEMIPRLKVETMSPVAALADAFVWGTVKPFLTVFAAVAALAGSWEAPVVFWLLFFLLTNFFRVYTFFAGLEMGLGVVFHLSKLRLQEVIELMRKASLVFFGGASLVFLAILQPVLRTGRQEYGVFWVVLPAYFVLNAAVFGRLRREVNFAVFVAFFAALYYLGGGRMAP